ncbi:MAG: DUF5658 family protein [bacterium]
MASCEADYEMIHPVQEDRRAQKDRRSRPTLAFSKYIFLGKRKAGRREGELRHIYVDRYSQNLFILLCLLLILCIIDGYFTILNVLYLDVPEMNPLMDYFLRKGEALFFSIKYGITGIGVVVLCLRIHFKFMQSALLALIFLYLFVVWSHIYIFLGM